MDTKTPEIPPGLLGETDRAIGHRDELYQIGCKLGQWFCRNGYSEDECADWLIDQSPLRGNYTARQFEYQLKRAVKFVYETYDPAKRGGERQAPADAAALQSLMGRVQETKIRKHKKYLLALIQHSINQGVNPVFVTARQLASLVGAKNWSKANEALVFFEQTAHPEGVVTGVSRELVHHGGHSYFNRAFTLNEHWEGYINTMHDTYVSLSAEQLEAKRLRAEQRQARKAERERYDREYELRMRYFYWAAQRALANLGKAPAPDPFGDPIADPFAGPTPDWNTYVPEWERSPTEIAWPSPV